MDRLRQYRFLAIVCSLAILAGAWEFFHGAPNERSNRGANGGTPKMTELPPDRDVFAKAFAQTSNAEFDLGLADYNQQKYTEALAHFRKAVATGVKTNEDLLWYYAMTLLYVDGDEAEIDQAIGNWRRNFPHSEDFHTYYNPYWTYAFQLMANRAKPEKVQAAVTRWERKKPADSQLPDLRNPPRELFEQRP